MLNTQLCDELDRKALQIAFDKWRGNPVNPQEFKLAAANLVSYGIYLLPDVTFSRKGDPAPMFSASEEDVEKAFTTCLSYQGTDAKKIGDGTFLKTILPVVLKLLMGFLV